MLRESGGPAVVIAVGKQGWQTGLVCVQRVGHSLDTRFVGAPLRPAENGLLHILVLAHEEVQVLLRHVAGALGLRAGLARRDDAAPVVLVEALVAQSRVVLLDEGAPEFADFRHVHALERRALAPAARRRAAAPAARRATAPAARRAAASAARRAAAAAARRAAAPTPRRAAAATARGFGRSPRRGGPAAARRALGRVELDALDVLVLAFRPAATFLAVVVAAQLLGVLVALGALLGVQVR